MVDHVHLPSFDPEAFASAKPFPHAVFRDVISKETGREALKAFTERVSWGVRDTTEIERNKSCCEKPTGVAKEITDQLLGDHFLAMLQELTGIEDLVADPRLTGGGLHITTVGGYLMPHLDFNEFRGMTRRVNLLLYLNEDWKDDDGGELLLLGEDGTKARIIPEMGTMGIFNTHDHSWHGHPIGNRRDRYSIASYYYTPGFEGRGRGTKLMPGYPGPSEG